MFFTTRPITVDHIRAFCSKFNEGYRVEYKSTFDASVREKLPKILSSFGNSHGGVLVIGVSAPNGAPCEPIEGFNSNSREELELTVENICLQGIYPPLLTRVALVASDAANRHFLIIEVDESPQAPHAIENSKKVYVRTGSASQPYDLANVDVVFGLANRRKQSFELRGQLVDRSKLRLQRYLDVKHADKGGHRTELGTILQFSAGPKFPSRPLCRQEELKTLIQNHTTYWRGVKFPDRKLSIISQFESAIVLDPALGTSFFEINVWGMVFQAATLEVAREGTNGIHLPAFLGHILLFVRAASEMLRALGYSGLVTIETVLSPVHGVNWLHSFGGYVEAISGSRLDDEIMFEVPTDSEEMSDNPDRVAVEIFRNVFFSASLADWVDGEDKLEGLVRSGYQYGQWTYPQK